MASRKDGVCRRSIARDLCYTVAAHCDQYFSDSCRIGYIPNVVTSIALLIAAEPEKMDARDWVMRQQRQ